MSAGLPSDEVVDDYKNSLDDLVANDRISIGNLTVIAKECIEHAQAIARILENHILRTPPARKLPAFYVLDSIAKNVGTPYTVYFGLNLFHTYMNTFASVDNAVRRKLDEMRKTWSQPVPGSMSSYPVFPKTVTSKIDEAMESWVRRQFPNRNPQLPSRGPMAQVQAPPYRNTPTPPQPPPQQSYPGHQQYTNSNGASHIVNHAQSYAPVPNPTAHPMPTHYSQPTAPTPVPQNYLPSQQPIQQENFQYGQSSYPSPLPASVDLDALNRDIDDLIVDAKIGSYSHPMDRASQQKLASLQSLKELVDSGTLSQRDLTDVRKSVSEQLAARSNNQPTPPPVPTPQQQMSVPYHQPPPHIPPPGTGAPSFLNSNNLAELLRATAPQSHPAPPPVNATPIPPAVEIQPDRLVHPVPPPPIENPLIAQLRASGLLHSTPTPPTLGTPFTPPVTTTKATINHAAASASVAFTSSSFKTPKPELLRYFFDMRPNRCNTCGRRFTSDEFGRAKKARHLDWHFKTRTRLVETERRGAQRSWYVDEREWIKSREFEDDEGPAEENGDGSRLSPSAGGANVKAKKEAFVRVPNNAKLRSEPCPICQEKFESTWSEELQDFIWRDAIEVGNRVYHASCFHEATRDRENLSTPMAAAAATLTTSATNDPTSTTTTTTPDSVLGKRKAHDAITEESRVMAKVKTEPLG